jgi:hypothetical protein
MIGSILPCGGLGQVAGVFLERVIAFLGRGTVGRATLAQVVDRAVELLGGDLARVERVLGARLDHGSAMRMRSTGTKLSPAFFAIFSASSSTLGRLLVEIGLARVARDLGILPIAASRLVHGSGEPPARRMRLAASPWGRP